ncbi:hypothetical protein J6590_034689 [Homalodisca vitripennis]|nr:hypothetical protein J6590_034689 [Homalodisca vitripennis]
MAGAANRIALSQLIIELGYAAPRHPAAATILLKDGDNNIITKVTSTRASLAMMWRGLLVGPSIIQAGGWWKGPPLTMRYSLTQGTVREFFIPTGHSSVLSSVLANFSCANVMHKTSEPTPMAGQAGCLQGQDRSAVTHPSSSHARRCLTQLSRDNRRTRYTAPNNRDAILGSLQGLNYSPISPLSRQCNAVPIPRVPPPPRRPALSSSFPH